MEWTITATFLLNKRKTMISNTHLFQLVHPTIVSGTDINAAQVDTGCLFYFLQYRFLFFSNLSGTNDLYIENMLTLF